MKLDLQELTEDNLDDLFKSDYFKYLDEEDVTINHYTICDDNDKYFWMNFGNIALNILESGIINNYISEIVYIENGNVCQILKSRYRDTIEQKYKDLDLLNRKFLFVNKYQLLELIKFLDKFHKLKCFQ